MFKQIVSKLALSQTSRLYSVKCPPPKYDTGCTYCSPPAEMAAMLKAPPESIKHTMPPLKKIIVYLSNNKNNDEWPKKVEAYDIMRNMSKVGRGNGNMICLSSLKPRDAERLDTEAGFLVYPDAKHVYFNPNDESNYGKFFKMMEAESLDPTDSLDVLPVTKTTVLICGHTQRDARCGVVGKLVFEEFTKVLEHEKLADKVDLGFISHVGGHVYAGNLVILKPNGKVMWYGMVRPHFVQGIVQESIKNDRVIEELSRD